MNQTLEALAEVKSDGIFAIASTEETDRVGDVILSAGWDLENFKKNPVIQFAHQYNEPPVAVAKNIKVQNKQLVFEVVFHNITEKAREIGEMYKQGIMRAFSVGFIPRQLNKDNPHIIEKSELLEISAVPVPANAGALAMLTKEITPEEKEEVEAWLKKEVIAEVVTNAASVSSSSSSSTSSDILSDATANEADDKKEDKCCGDKKKETEEKSGRVISGKNREIIQEAKEKLDSTSVVLGDLLAMTEHSTVSSEVKGRSMEVYESRKKRIVTQALRKIDKVAGDTLRHIKQYE